VKIVIIGDIHLGAGYSFGRPDPETGINSRLLDYEKTLSNIITYTINKKFELCIMLGDVFETRNPSPQQMVIFYKQLKRLSAAGITTLVISGNHDYIKTRQITSSLDPLKEINIPYISVYTEIDLVQFADSNNELINILLMPYRNRQSYDKQSNEDAVMEMTKEVHAAKLKAADGTPTLLVGHMMMENTIPADAGEYGINELVLPFDIFEGIDVVVNGHIHRPSILKESPLFIYSGSMECKDFSEKDHQKCFLIYDSAQSGVESVTFKGIPTRKFIDFEIDYSSNFPENPMEEITKRIQDTSVFDAVVKLSVKVPETKVAAIDTAAIRAKFHELDVNCISDISVSPVISKQLRNQKVNDAPDDMSAFKHYVSAQTNVADSVLVMGLAIIAEELEG
jgi:exonuclease SbcD